MAGCPDTPHLFAECAAGVPTAAGTSPVDVVIVDLKRVTSRPISPCSAVENKIRVSDIAQRNSSPPWVDVRVMTMNEHVTNGHNGYSPSRTPSAGASSRAMLETTEIAIAASPEDLRIEIQDPRGGIRRVSLSEEKPLTIGSRSVADVRVRDHTVSSKHCAVFVRAGVITVKDLGSRNGTFVGGARVVNEVSCQIGMTVVIGQTTITFVRMSDERMNDADVGGFDDGAPLPGVAGSSSAMCNIASLVRRFAKQRAPVLITGETGVGKELIARALHGEGLRAGGPFVAINASTLPRELVETELFGHERGAFTGAVARRAGAFDIAEGGTLFLDEIGELPLEAQPKLLRALDGYEVRAVGAASAGRRMDVRVVCATHVPLAQQVRLGSFRRDLFHRLEVLVIRVPPLRERRGDILPIARAILDGLRDEHGDRELTPSAIGYLTAHDWPGNVRELKNVLMRALDIGKRIDRWIEPDAIRQALRPSTDGAGSDSHPAASSSGPSSIRVAVTPLEAHRLLSRCRGNISAAARAASVPRTTFRKLLKRHQQGACDDAPAAMTPPQLSGVTLCGSLTARCTE